MLVGVEEAHGATFECEACKQLLGSVQAAAGQCVCGGSGPAVGPTNVECMATFSVSGVNRLGAGFYESTAWKESCDDSACE